MGFLDKVKNLFTEEIEIEETPIKKEVMKVEIPAPIMQPEKKVSQTEVEVEPVKEEKPRTPVFFDDKDFIDLDTPKVQEKVKKEEPVRREELYGSKKEAYTSQTIKKDVYGIKKEEVKKKFAPSPIISPVYGVLDKNYHKEDIASKAEMKARKLQREKTYSRTLTIDDVMLKAHGETEEPVIKTRSKSILFEEEITPKREDKNYFDDFNLLQSEPEDTKLNEFTSQEKDTNIDPLSGLELDVKEDDLMNDNFGETEPVKVETNLEEMHKEEDLSQDIEEKIDLKESELFDLIDAMYEKREENDD